MQKAELYDALDGLMAYDGGCTDSGIKDEDLRERVFTYLRDLIQRDRTQFRLLISRYAREYYLSEAKLARRYGIDDVASFIEWMGDNGIDLGG